MAITDGIVLYLKQNATLMALLGSVVNSIVPTGQVKGAVSPFVVYHIGTAVATYTAQGDTPIKMARFQFDCYSSASYTEARNVAVALRNAIKNSIGVTLPDTDDTYVYAFQADPPIWNWTDFVQGEEEIDAERQEVKQNIRAAWGMANGVKAVSAEAASIWRQRRVKSLIDEGWSSEDAVKLVEEAFEDS